MASLPRRAAPSVPSSSPPTSSPRARAATEVSVCCSGLCLGHRYQVCVHHCLFGHLLAVHHRRRHGHRRAPLRHQWTSMSRACPFCGGPSSWGEPGHDRMPGPRGEVGSWQAAFSQINHWLPPCSGFLVLALAFFVSLLCCHKQVLPRLEKVGDFCMMGSVCCVTPCIWSCSGTAPSSFPAHLRSCPAWRAREAAAWGVRTQ